MTFTKKALKQLINDKFGGIKRFCDVANLEKKDYQLIKRLVAEGIKDTETEKTKRCIYYNIAYKTMDRYLDNEITQDNRKWIRTALKSLYKGVDGFSRQYPQISKSTIRDIIDGRTIKKTQAYNVLLETLKEEINEG
jgi:hypothetical protein